MLRLGRADVLRCADAGCAGGDEYVEDGSRIDSIVPDSHGLSAGGGHNNREADDEEVGHPPGGLLQALGFLPGKLFRHRGDQGLRQGGQGADGFPEAERGEREGQY